MARRILLMAGCAVVFLAACSEKTPVLPGKREPLREAAPEVVNEERAIRLPGSSNNSAWTHRIGTPSTRNENAALAKAPSLLWSANIGQGEKRKSRITADPIVAEGRIFTVDAEALLSATSTSGALIWQKDLTPANERSDAGTGGGMAFAGGRLYVSTGFGVLKALDAATGALVWEQRLEAVGSGTPTIYGGTVYLVSGDDTAWSIDADTGKVNWRIGTISSATRIQTPSAPAVNDRFSVFAFGNGDVSAAFRKGGVQRWGASVTGKREGRALASVGDVSGDPVISGSRVYAVNHSGRAVMLDLETGERLWTATEGAINPVWPVGGSVFLVSERNQLIRLNGADGQHIWAVDLPLFVKEKPTRQAEQYTHYGPILAGGLLRVASSDGQLRSFDPASGRLVSSVEIPGGAATGMAVAGGTLYVVGLKGQLHAFR